MVCAHDSENVPHGSVICFIIGGTWLIHPRWSNHRGLAIRPQRVQSPGNPGRGEPADSLIVTMNRVPAPAWWGILAPAVHR